MAGERADPDTIKWAENLLKKPVIDHWWQTETGWAISANCAGLGLFETKYGSAGKAVPGYNIQILKPDGTQAQSSEMGDVVVKLPLPPGTFPTLWKADKRYKENYMDPYKGYYKTYDAGHIDENGYVWIMSRTDDIINVAGHRLSTGSMEVNIIRKCQCCRMCGAWNCRQFKRANTSWFNCFKIWSNKKT